jgi:hypothetical protein
MIEYHYEVGKTIAYIKTTSKFIHLLNHLWLKIIGFKTLTEKDQKEMEN